MQKFERYCEKCEHFKESDRFPGRGPCVLTYRWVRAFEVCENFKLKTGTNIVAAEKASPQ